MSSEGDTSMAVVFILEKLLFKKKFQTSWDLKSDKQSTYNLHVDIVHDVHIRENMDTKGMPVHNTALSVLYLSCLNNRRQQQISNISLKMR